MAANENGLTLEQGQSVKTLSQRTVDFIVSITHSASFCWPGLLMLAQSLLIALVGVLQ